MVLIRSTQKYPLSQAIHFFSEFLVGLGHRCALCLRLQQLLVCVFNLALMLILKLGYEPFVGRTKLLHTNAVLFIKPREFFGMRLLQPL